MEGNKFDCTLSYDPTQREDSSKEREYVFVPFNLIFDYKVRETNFELQYKIIQKLKEIRDGKKPYENETGKLPTKQEHERALIKAYLDRYRPDTTYKEIASMMNMSKKTLWVKRNEYDLP